MIRNINRKKLKLIESFKDDWNGYGAKPISKNVIQQAYEINSKLQYPLEIFPRADNSVQFEMDLADDYIEFQVMEDKIECFIIQNEKEYYINVSKGDINTINQLTENFVKGRINEKR